MTGKFKGYKYIGGEYTPVEGSGVLFVNSKAYILKSSVPTLEQVTRVQVVPASVSQGVYVQGLGHIFKGDVVRFTFREKSEYYNRYYQVVEQNNLYRFMELYRDYMINECDFSIERGKYTNHKGDSRDIDTPMNLNETYTLVGNTYCNPEFTR